MQFLKMVKSTVATPVLTGEVKDALKSWLSALRNKAEALAHCSGPVDLTHNYEMPLEIYYCDHQQHHRFSEHP